MKTRDFIKLEKSVEKLMDPKRYEHTLGVAYTACSMAMRYGADVNKARIAGLLHDCAKCMDDKKKLEICKKNHLTITSTEANSPFLLHGKVGAYLAKEKFDIADDDILNAITYHTTGRPGMSDLEKIIYIADFIEPNRKQLEIMEEARRMAFTDLDACIVFIMGSIINHLETNGDPIDDTTIRTYQYYKEQI